MNKCEYGCGQEAKYTLKNGMKICSSRHTQCPELKQRNSNGLKRAYKDGRMEYKGQMDDHRGWAKGLTAATDQRIKANVKYDPDTMWSIGGKGPHKILLIQERGYKCEKCGIDEWQGDPITLEMDHINGESNDNRKENLRLLCPNCHSQTPTFRRRKTKGESTLPGNRIHTDLEIIRAVKLSKTMNDALKYLGLKWGSNKSVRKVMEKYSIDFD